MNIVVTPLTDADAAAAAALIVAGLSERWGSYDARCNPDLAAFPSAYAGAVVLVARHGDDVVGAGVMETLDDSVGRIVRMSVAAEHRRCGVGSRILAALLRVARDRGIGRIELETTATWSSAVAFYLANGFRPIGNCAGDQHFVLEIDRGYGRMNS